MKLAKIIPVFKSGNKNIIENDINIICLLRFKKKTWVTISLNTSMNMNCYTIVNLYLEETTQHAHTHAIITYVEKVTQTLEKGKYVVGVFLNLKRAFDTVNQLVIYFQSFMLSYWSNFLCFI